MKLVRVGKVGRPHSYKGVFFVQDHAGQDSEIGNATSIWVGATPEKATSHPIAEARWNGQIWLLKLAGVESDSWVKEHVHQSLFLDRDTFAKIEADEYYVTDLEGFAAIDAESGETIGTFLSAEPLPDGFGPDRWWFKVGDREVAVPAIAEFVEAVDKAARTITVRGLKEMP